MPSRPCSRPAMAGFAFGSYVFGRWVDRRRNTLLAYAALEAGVGLYALLVPSLLAALRPAYVLLHRLDVPHAALASGRALLAALVLLVPTTLMGGTFPALVRAIIDLTHRGKLGYEPATAQVYPGGG